MSCFFDFDSSSQSQRPTPAPQDSPHPAFPVVQFLPLVGRTPKHSTQNPTEVVYAFHSNSRHLFPGNCLSGNR